MPFMTPCIRCRSVIAYGGIKNADGTFCCSPSCAKVYNQPPSEESALQPIQMVESSTEKKCPFCAETIRAEAVVCRFCQRNLKPKSGMGVVTRIVGFAILALIAVRAITMLGGAIKNPQEAESSPIPAANVFATKGSIDGGAFISWEIRGSEVLRGQDIALCKDSFKLSFDADPFLREMSKDRYTPMEAEDFKLAMSRLTTLFRTDRVAQTATDIDGKYKFADIEPGNYNLVSIYVHDETFGRSRNCKGCAYWIVPVTVSEGSAHCDLKNNNMTGTFKFYEY